MRKSGTKQQKRLERYHCTACCLDACFLFSEHPHLTKTKRLVGAFDPLFCVHRAALWCQLPSQRGRKSIPITCKKSCTQSAEQLVSDKVSCHFWGFWSERRRGGEKEMGDGVRQGSGAGPRLIMTWGHGMCLSWRRHKGTNVLGYFKNVSWNDTTGASFILQEPHIGKDFIVYMKNRVRRKPALEASQVEFDVQAGHFAMVPRYSTITALHTLRFLDLLTGLDCVKAHTYPGHGNMKKYC